MGKAKVREGAVAQRMNVRSQRRRPPGKSEEEPAAEQQVYGRK